jgi:hypothetical protein
LRCVSGGANFFEWTSHDRGSVFKAWVETRDPRRTSPLGRGGEVRPYAPRGEGLTRRPGVLCRDALVFSSVVLWLSFSDEDRAGGASVGGEPVEVFVGERFGRVAERVDDADGAFILEDRDGE